MYGILVGLELDPVDGEDVVAHVRVDPDLGQRRAVDVLFVLAFEDLRDPELPRRLVEGEPRARAAPRAGEAEFWKSPPST